MFLPMFTISRVLASRLLVTYVNNAMCTL